MYIIEFKYFQHGYFCFNISRWPFCIGKVSCLGFETLTVKRGSTGRLGGQFYFHFNGKLRRECCTFDVINLENESGYVDQIWPRWIRYKFQGRSCKNSYISQMSEISYIFTSFFFVVERFFLGWYVLQSISTHFQASIRYDHGHLKFFNLFNFNKPTNHLWKLVVIVTEFIIKNTLN